MHLWCKGLAAPFVLTMDSLKARIMPESSNALGTFRSADRGFSVFFCRFLGEEGLVSNL